jgi:hydroxyacylglutathione hydrolase
MFEVATNVRLLRGVPDYVVNVYLVGDVLIDASTRMAERGILRQLKGQRLSAHVLTHVHPDHQGASKAVCDAFHIPLRCGERDAAAMESGDLHGLIPSNFLTRTMNNVAAGPAHPVERTLHEGDEVAGFTVLETPGHSPGHLAYWRDSDRTLILGDVARNINFLTLQTELGEPPVIFTPDVEQNRASIRKLAALNPRTVLFGHGKPLQDGARFVDFAASLP